MKPRKSSALPTPHRNDAEAVQADPGVLAADPFAAEKQALGDRLAHIIDALKNTHPLEDAGQIERAAKAMREVHEAGGRTLTDAEVVEFIGRRINLGSPRRAPKPAHGPQSRDTQYDLAYARRKGLYQKLVRLPGLRVGKGKIDLERVAKLAAKLVADGERDRDLIRLIYERVQGKSGEQITKGELMKARDLLRKLGRWPGALLR